MNGEPQTELFEQFYEVEEIAKAVDLILTAKFEFKASTNNHKSKGLVRVKRGHLYDTVISVLGMDSSNQLKIIIRAVVESKGGVPYISVGKLYFKNVCEKKGISKV